MTSRGRRACGALAIVGALVACGAPYPPPPETRRADVYDTLHGVEFVDPYRWLEVQDAAETRAWIDAQVAYAESVVGEPPLRERLRERVRALLDAPDKSAPRRAGDFEYFTLRRVGQELPVIYRRPRPPDGDRIPIDPDADYEVVIDPLAMSDDQTTRVSILSLASDGRLMIYGVRDGGEDEIRVRVRELSTGRDLPDSMPRALYSGVSFNPSASGFYYSRRSRETGARIRFHRLGTAFAEDRELFGEGYGPTSFVGMRRAARDRYRLFTVSHGWTRGELHVQDMRAGGAVAEIAAGETARFSPQFLEGTLYLRTNLDAPNNRVVTVDLADPAVGRWRTVVPDGDEVMQGFSAIDGKLYVTYLQDVSTRIRVYEFDGTPAGDVSVPPLHRASIRGAGEGKAFLTLSSFTTPPVTYLLDLETGEREVWERREVPFDSTGIVVEQVWYPSKDGTRIPMFVMHRRDVVLDGENPALLYGYGGFNVALAPRFDVNAAIWVELGGVFAQPSLRGGSEFGETWHRAGMLENKQNVFDDFIAAAEWLIAQGYTRPERLAIRGGSNGGLLVASAFTQRPELFRAVLCAFPDLDMVRFYTFTETNNLPALHEYGDASDPEQFAFLRAYSPYQRVRDGTRYPAVMLTSGDRDTRVPPLQARKMTARLQHATRSGRPVVLRYGTKAGHAAGRGRPFSRVIEDIAAELTFLLAQVGVDPDGDGGS